jgi:type III pantothenate kinase
MKLLVIDAGNTRLKWAVTQVGNMSGGSDDMATWISRGVLATPDAVSTDALRLAWQPLEFSQVIVSNVAGQAIRDAIVAALLPRRIVPVFIQSALRRCGVTNGYALPAQLGTDRFAALIAAHRMRLSAPAHQLVIMAGTALTIDALTRDGEFPGGVIVPGPTLMRQSLNRGTAQLPGEEGRHDEFPQGTLDAIATGTIDAAVGAIMRMRARLAQRTEATVHEIALTLSGGAVGELVPHLQDFAISVTINDNLVLDGLLALWRDEENTRTAAGRQP